MLCPLQVYDVTKPNVKSKLSVLFEQWCWCWFVSESYLGTKVKNAVITVPAYFNDSQRQVLSLFFSLLKYWRVLTHTHTHLLTLTLPFVHTHIYTNVGCFICYRQQKMLVRLLV